jgi:hypothetical protein
MKKSSLFAASVNTTTKKWSVDADVPPVPKAKSCHFVGREVN